MNSTYVTLCGLVATEPRLSVRGNLPITSFRLVATSRRYDAESQTWVDGESTWVTVTCFRGLATHAYKSLAKRDRVIVHGRLATREWGDPKRVNVELDADGIGHDLTFGTSSFTRTVGVSQTSTAESGGESEEAGEPVVAEREPSPVEASLPPVQGGLAELAEADEREELFAGAPPF